MATSVSNLAATKQQEEQVEDSDSDTDENSCQLVKVDIAVVGNTGCGRSSFVNAILGFEENDDKNAATASNGKETSSYCHPTSPNITFSILPSIDEKTFPIFNNFFKCDYIEKFDAFLILTNDMFDKRHFAFAKTVVKSSNKAVFFVRTKFDNNNNSQGVKEESKEEMSLPKLKETFAKKLKEFELNKSEIYLISNHQPDKWDFLKLTNAIEAALPSQKRRFSKIPIIQKLIALEKFHNFLEVDKLKQGKIANYDEIKELFLTSGIAGVQSMINKKLGLWKEVKLELAVLGHSGAGKSSFVNAMRGIQDDDENAVITGVTKTTNVPTAFPHPTNPNIRFWDLPGIGTPNYPDVDTFCNMVCFQIFDSFMILSTTRFTESDKLLAAKVKSMGKSIFFIRSKIDNDKRAEKRLLKNNFEEKKMLSAYRNQFIRRMRDLGFGAEDIYLISSHYPDKWDFSRLQKAILDQLPSKQKESLIFTIQIKSKDVLRDKIELLKSRLWMVSASLVSKKFGFGPFSHYVVSERVKEIIQSYSFQLQFPTGDSRKIKMLSENLQRKVRKFIDEPYQDILQWLKSFDRDNTHAITEYKKYIVTKRPLIFLQYILTAIVDEMGEVALAILDETAENEQNDDDSD